MSSDSGRSWFQRLTHDLRTIVLSRKQRAAVAFAVAALTFSSGIALDWFVTHRYLPRASLVLAGAAAASVVGLLVFKILTDIQEHYLALQDRLRRVAELNHHIRNALQVIAYHNVPERSGRGVQQVSTEIVRIESALRELSVALGGQAGLPTAVVPTGTVKTNGSGASAEQDGQSTTP